jgi:uncharacterized protein (DUF2384 family)
MSGRFRRPPATKLSPEEQVRQGRIVSSAHAAMPTVEAVRSFLNTHHDGLRGRPLDVAVASEAGLLAVEAAIAAEHGSRRARRNRRHET